jgi:AraC-like DNA-binding protein
MKAKLENINQDNNSSFRILVTPNLNDVFYWHFHPEYEIVYVEAENGTRHIGEHISKYNGSDIAFIGPYIPHLNFDYGIKQTVNTVVIQMKSDFLGENFFSLPEMIAIKSLFDKAKTGLAFFGKTKEVAGQKLKELPHLQPFDQLIKLLELFQILANSADVQLLHVKPIANETILKLQQRLQKINHYVENHYQNKIDVHEVAALCNMTTAAFCRYFKKETHFTFTDFLNQFRINQSKKLLLQNKNVTETCFDCGFVTVSYFNKTFKKITGENPSTFKKNHR